MRFSKRRSAKRLVFGALLLLISILIGTRIGNKVMLGGGDHGSDLAVDLPTAVPESIVTLAPADRKWKHVQVLSVATDPAFPDPRITPTPEPTPTAAPSATPAPQAAAPRSSSATAQGPAANTRQPNFGPEVGPAATAAAQRGGAAELGE